MLMNSFHPLFRQPGEHRKPVVQIDAIAQAFPAGQSDHLLRLRDIVRDGFLSQHVTPSLQRLQGRLVVVAPIFKAARGHRAQTGLHLLQHLGRTVKRRDSQPRRGGIRTLRDSVADSHEFAAGNRAITIGMAVSDGPHSDDGNALHRQSPFISARNRTPPVSLSTTVGAPFYTPSLRDSIRRQRSAPWPGARSRFNAARPLIFSEAARTFSCGRKKESWE